MASNAPKHWEEALLDELNWKKTPFNTLLHIKSKCIGVEEVSK